MGSFNTLNKIRCNFSVIPNALIEDCSLSDRARFLFVFMASKPDNWLFYRNKLANDIGYHVETLDKYMKELISSGWVVKSKQAISEDGKFGSVSYYLMDVPVTENFHNEPMGKITVTENYRDGKFPKHNNKDILNNKDNINNKECKYSACASEDDTLNDKTQYIVSENEYNVDTMYPNFDTRKEKKRKEKKSKEYNSNELLQNQQKTDIEKIEIEPIQPKKRKEKVPPKRKEKFGEFNNVLLTLEEHSKLSAMVDDVSALLDFFSREIEMKGYKYASHYLAIRKWGLEAYDKYSKRLLPANSGNTTGHQNYSAKSVANNKRAELDNLESLASAILQNSPT